MYVSSRTFSQNDLKISDVKLFYLSPRHVCACVTMCAYACMCKCACMHVCACTHVCTHVDVSYIIEETLNISQLCSFSLFDNQDTGIVSFGDRCVCKHVCTHV